MIYQKEIKFLRSGSRWIIRVASVVAISWSVFQLYTAGTGFFHVMVQRPIHLGFALILSFLTYPLIARKTADSPGELGAGIKDVIFALFAAAAIAYLLIDQGRIIERVTFVDPVETADIIVGLGLILLTLEAGRRTLGYALPSVALFFMAYLFWGHLFPIQSLAHRGISLSRFIDMQILTPTGLFGIPIGVSTDTVFYFLLFAAFLEISGGGRLFTDVAFKITGRARGGSAKAAVVGSSLMGTISGSAVANVVGTGIFTIPMMKRGGYPGYFSGAVEAVSSTGGQIMPPVMGAGAFVMAEMLGVPYAQIVKAAIIPAVTYYLALYLIVDRKAKQDGLAAIPASELPKVEIAQRFHLLFPLALLVYLIFEGRSLMLSSTISIATIVPLSLLRTSTRMNWRKILIALENGAKQAVSAAIPCAIAGIIVGIIVFTGLGLRLSSFIVSISGGNIFLAMALVMCGCIILGTGMPTTAAYIISAAVMAPALVELKMIPIAAHMFCFYFACLSMVTPPVALAAFAAASLAGSGTWKTGWTAFILAVGGVVIPFAFARNPALLLQITSIPDFLWVLATVIVGIYALSSAVIYMGPSRFGWLFRPAYVVAGFLLVDPGKMTDLIGLGLLVLVLLLSRFGAKDERVLAEENKA
ncbi:MAG: TRAP transporter fused permease subunit [Deltaproteobacteria bacterium]|nr:TRAP transporter fused permease subunit [Deltaproteobacteria bacterium]